MAQKIVGLDIGSYSIKAVVLESTFRGWEMIGFEEMEIASEYVEAEAMIEKSFFEEEEAKESEENEEAEEEEAEDEEADEGEREETIETETIERETFDPHKERIRSLVRQFIQRHGAEWDVFYTALDGDQISIKLLSLPFGDPKQIAQTIDFSLEEVLPFSLTDKVFDYQILNVEKLDKERSKTTLLAGVLDRERMGGYLHRFGMSGKEPKGVIIDSLALGYLFEALADPSLKEGSQALVDIGHRKTSVCILHEGKVAYIRTIPIGGQDLTLALSKAFELPFDEAERGKHLEGFLPSEILKPKNSDQEAIALTLEKAIQPLIQNLQLTFQSYTAKMKHHIESVHLTGGSSKLNNIDGYLAEHLKVPTQPFHFLKNEFNSAPGLREDEPTIAMGLGIAFAGLSGTKGKRLNFRKGEFAFKGDFELWKGRIVHLSFSAMVVFFFFILNVWSQFHVVGAEHDQLTDKIESTCKRILGNVNQAASDPKICISQMMEIIGKDTGGDDMKPNVSLVKIYDELVSRLTADGVDVDIKTLDITDKKIKLKGEVDSHPTVDIIHGNLNTYYCFEEISPGKSQQSVQGNRVQFSFSIAVNCTDKRKKEFEKMQEKAMRQEADEKEKAAAEALTPSGNEENAPDTMEQPGDTPAKGAAQ